MAKCRFTCVSATERVLVQNPGTKDEINVMVYDAELSVAKNSEDNKAFFVAQHGGALKLVACTMKFEGRRDYWIDISPAEPPPAAPAKPA